MPQLMTPACTKTSNR